MKFGEPVSHGRFTRNLTALLGTASFVAMLAGGAGQAQAAAAAATGQVQEEVLVTGSLIRGTVAVGVPVNAVNPEDIIQTGQVTLTEVLKTIPALHIDAEASPTYGGGTLSFEQNVQIHGLGTGAGVETLLLVDGLRWPPQNYSNDTVNPSIIPPIAIDRVDILSAGASAVYGSDATAGVINIILKRGYDGALTQASIGGSPDIGYLSGQFSQLYGTTWDTGNITLSYAFTGSSHLEASKRNYYTQDFSPWGLMDFTPIGSSMPAIVTTGNAKTVTGTPAGESSANGTLFCSNCFSVPKGTGWNYGDTVGHTNPIGGGTAATTSWATLTANPGIKNEINPWLYGDARPELQTNAATLTLDQKLTEDFFGLGPVALWADGFYSNQRGRQVYIGNNGEERQSLAKNLAVPTSNPYYPTGAPSGLKVDYSFAAEVPVIDTGGEVAGRYAGGFNFARLPFEWRGKLTYSMSDDHNTGDINNAINSNNVNAALGNTVTDPTGAVASYTKPSNVPYLNVFCDPTVFQCNSPATLAYIVGHRYQREHWKIQETGLNLDGPLFDLPGGTVQAAVAGQTLSEHYSFISDQNDNKVIGAAFPQIASDYEAQSSVAVFGQLDVPIFGQDFTLPLVQSLVVEAGYRYDKYNNLADPVYTPKIAVNWGVGDGLTIRGAWGKSFRVPSFAEASPVQSTISGVNPLGLNAANDLAILDCGSVNGSTPGVALPGSLTAALNPTCVTDPAHLQPGGLDVSGGGTGAATLLRGKSVGPQTLKQWSVGFNFTPTDPILGVNLTGLNADVSWFNLEFFGLISGNGRGQGPNDPASFAEYTVIPHPELPITDPSNAAFYALVQQLAFYPSRGGGFDPAAIPNIKFISDTALTNVGSRIFSGVDFNIRYDYDLGDLGSVNIGAAGYYEINDKSQAAAGAPVIGVYTGQDSGNRLQRVRYRLGWQNQTWNVTAFANYTGHGGINADGDHIIPGCFYQAGNGPGSCFPNSPFYGPYAVFPNYSPAQVTFDLSVGYQTGDAPANEYLRGIGLQLTVDDIFDRPPPFQVGARGSGSIRAFDNAFVDLQRTITLTVTKAW